jgi:hypothetical protein
MKFPRERIEPDWVISVKYLKDLKSKIENQIPIKYISDLDLEDIEAVLLAIELDNEAPELQELQEVLKNHEEWDGKSPHPYGCDGADMITDYQRRLMEHSLGGKDPKKWHRNHFMASPGHADLPDLRILEKNGMMKQIPTPSFCASDSILFHVTDAGKQEVKKGSRGDP